MTNKIKNVKTIQKKSKTHDIEQISANKFIVRSGSSKNEYTVTINNHGGKCTCKWAQYRPVTDNRSGCSHVVSVYNYIEGLDNRSISVWDNDNSANRQHRPKMNIGDGIILTSRVTE